MHPGSFEILPDGRLAVGTRRGRRLLRLRRLRFSAQPRSIICSPAARTRSSGSSWKDGAMTVTQFGEVTRITDTDGDEVADRFDTLTNNWGYAEGHEFAFGSKHDPEGNIWVALGLSGSYQSHNLFRGWAVKVTPDGRMIPVCSGLRSPAGVGAECRGRDVLHREPGTVEWLLFAEAPQAGRLSRASRRVTTGIPSSPAWTRPPVEPRVDSRMEVEKKRVKELVAAGSAVSLHQDGALDLRLPAQPDRREVRPLRRPAFPRRLHAEHHHAGDHRADQRGVAGRVLSRSGKGSPPGS